MFINLESNRSRVPISIQIESKSNGPFLMPSNRLAQVTGFINRDIFQFFSLRKLKNCETSIVAPKSFQKGDM